MSPIFGVAPYPATSRSIWPEVSGARARSMRIVERDIRERFRKMTITIYGIRNCDTMKKARAWLDGHGIAYGFHDYKTDGIAREKLKRWCDDLGWEALLNRAGTTFRKLPDADKDGLNERKALALMLAQPSMI